MPGANAAILRYAYLGFENTSGTAVTPNRALRSVSLSAEPVQPVATLSSMGSVTDEAQVAGLGAHTKATLEGFLAFNDIALLLCTLQKAGTITTPGGATNARDWTFLFTKNGAEMPKTLTVEEFVSGGDGLRFAYALLNSLRLDLSGTDRVGLTADVIGRRMIEEGLTASSTPTEIVNVPATLSKCYHYIADTVAGLSSGKQTDVYGNSFEIPARRKPLFPKDGANASFAGLVRLKNDVSVSLQMEKGSQSDLLMRQLRANTLQYYRLLLTGPEIETGVNYEFEVTMPFTVNDPGRGTNEDLKVATYLLKAMDDLKLGATLGGYLQIRVRCALTAIPSSSTITSGQAPETLLSGLSSVGSA